MQRPLQTKHKAKEALSCSKGDFMEKVVINIKEYFLKW